MRRRPQGQAGAAAEPAPGIGRAAAPERTRARGANGSQMSVAWGTGATPTAPAQPVAADSCGPAVHISCSEALC
ncbi:hypothetical protein [Massilia sp. WF1]|uniref:hypothetical protein n=1 Tax=Massilia sp. WF1 TaxID=1406431 RepID=UPI0012E2E6E5|nr:hypothetical protein [Massilia sp. WF1]